MPPKIHSNSNISNHKHLSKWSHHRSNSSPVCSIIQLELIIENACTVRVCLEPLEIAKHFSLLINSSRLVPDMSVHGTEKSAIKIYEKKEKLFSLQRQQLFDLVRQAFLISVTWFQHKHNKILRQSPVLCHYFVVERLSLTARRHSVAGIHLQLTPPKRLERSDLSTLLSYFMFEFYEPKQTEMNF